MNYYLNPTRKKEADFEIKNLKTYYHHSNNCVDEITLIRMESEGDYFYQATGCAIFLASTDIFLEEASKSNFSKIEELSIAFEKLINQEKMSDHELDLIGKLSVFSNVKKHLNRVECSLMITKVLKKII